MSDLAIREFSDEQVGLIKRTIANDATDDELRLFLYQAQRTGLDPLARQIHFVKRKSKDGPSRASIQTGIDGYRLIADRTGKYAGNDDPAYTMVDDRLVAATVTVWKMVDGTRCPFTATARWEEYYPGDGKPGFMWRKMPHLMLGKTAEALALRKAFPAELSGIYTDSEMDQANAVEAEVVEPSEAEPSEAKTQTGSEPVKPAQSSQAGDAEPQAHSQASPSDGTGDGHPSGSPSSVTVEELLFSYPAAKVLQTARKVAQDTDDKIPASKAELADLRPGTVEAVAKVLEKSA